MEDEKIERLYSPGEVSDHLEIERQTVTKYARLFEENGYNFHKDDKGRRLYTDTNILMFKDLINQRNKHGITLETAAKSLTELYKSKSITVSDTELHTIETLLQEVQALKERLDKQEQFNEALINQLQKMDRSSLERHNHLTQSLKETMEERKLIAATMEEEEKAKKKGFFARLFGR